MIRDKEKRQFFRHPIHAPLRLTLERDPAPSLPVATEAIDVSLGGLSFYWHERLRKGDAVCLLIGVKDKSFDVRGRVAYCVGTARDGQYRSGIFFVDALSAFKAKLAEEALEILRYRGALTRELGREVSEEEAARRWIQEFAARFPNPAA